MAPVSLIFGMNCQGQTSKGKLAGVAMFLVRSGCSFRAAGPITDRPQLQRLWSAVRSRKVDCILVWKFDRFARSTKQLIDALEEFRHLGVDFISITEQIDTSSPRGKAMFTVISAIAEFERSLISERVRAGIAKARAMGKRHGRPAVDEQTIKEIRSRRRQGARLNQIARALGISHQTVANYAMRPGGKG